MKVEQISASLKISLIKKQREIKADKIIVKEKEIVFKMNVRVEVKFSFVKKIVTNNNKIDDDLLEVLSQMAVELSKLAFKKGRKRISLRFFDKETALKIASFENGKFLKDYITLMKMIELTDDLIYKDDKTVDSYEIIPKVTDYTSKGKDTNYTIERESIKFNINIVKRAYSLEYTT